MADGAKDNWIFLDALPVEGLWAIDLFHGAEHLSKALYAACGEGSRRLGCSPRIILRNDEKGVKKVIRSLLHLRSEHPRSKVIATELG